MSLEGQNLNQELQKVQEKMTSMSIFLISLKQQKIIIFQIHLNTEAQFQRILAKINKGFRLSNLMIINLTECC